MLQCDVVANYSLSYFLSASVLYCCTESFDSSVVAYFNNNYAMSCLGKLIGFVVLSLIQMTTDNFFAASVIMYCQELHVAISVS